MNFKKILFLFVILLVFVSGCIQANQKVTENENGNNIKENNEEPLTGAGHNKNEKILTEEENRQIVEDFVKASLTYKFDGHELNRITMIAINDLIDNRTNEVISCQGCYEYEYSFKSTNSGYANRAGKEDNVETIHRVKVRIENGIIIRAIIDNAWNIQSQSNISEEIYWNL